MENEQQLQPNIETQALTVQDEARALKIVDQVSLNLAASFIRDRIKPLLEEADKQFDGAIKSAFDAHRKILAAKRSVTEPLNQAETILRVNIRNFTRVEEEREKQRQHIAREEAERQAKAQREAELERIRKALDEEEQRLLQERERQIEQAENEGMLSEVARLTQEPIVVPNAGLAEAIEAEPLEVIVPAIAPAITLPTGIGLREPRYTAEIFDPILLCASIGRKETPLEYIDLEPSVAMKAIARKAKQSWNPPPGCRAVEDTTSGITVRRK